MEKKTSVPATAKAEEVKEVVAEESSAKKAYRAHLEKYREANPKKYALKKAEFERKLRGDIKIIVGAKSQRFEITNLPKE